MDLEARLIGTTYEDDEHCKALCAIISDMEELVEKGIISANYLTLRRMSRWLGKDNTGISYVKTKVASMETCGILSVVPGKGKCANRYCEGKGSATNKEEAWRKRRNEFETLCYANLQEEIEKDRKAVEEFIEYNCCVLPNGLLQWEQSVKDKRRGSNINIKSWWRGWSARKNDTSLPKQDAPPPPSTQDKPKISKREELRRGWMAHLIGLKPKVAIGDEEAIKAWRRAITEIESNGWVWQEDKLIDKTEI